MSRLCPNCNKETPQYQNYCGWDCMIELAKKSGGKVHTPNRLPIGCIKYDNTMLEHEHGDHPDYKFPVEAEYTGSPDNMYLVGPDEVKFKPDADELYSMTHETHALIYTDGCIAITMYECCYAMWRVSNGEVIGGSLWKKNEWKLTQASVDQIKGLNSNEKAH